MAMEVTKTLAALEPSYLCTTRKEAWNQRNPILPRKILKYPDALHLRTWRINAEGKGFNRRANLVQQRDKEDVAGKISKRDNGVGDDKIPEVVWGRMIGRILFYVGFPLVSGVVLLQIFDALKEKNLWDVPIWLPFLTTFLTFGASALGIAYGTLSTSLDPEREGSLLGFDEAQKNWVEMWKEEDD